jgi:mono/diheme cytochrome c family protein
MLKSSLLFCATALVAIVCLPIAGRSPQAASPAPALAPVQAAEPAQTVPTKNPVKPTAESQARAKQIYARDCALCHGDNGNGKSDLASSMNLTMADWTDPKTLADQPDSGLFAAIRNGKGEHMPPEDVGRANDTEVWNLIIYIRTFSKGQPSAGAPASAPAPPAN